IWPPPTVFSLPGSLPPISPGLGGLATRLSYPVRSLGEPLIPWAGPVDWLRVMIGVAVAVGAGILGTRPVIDALIKASEGYFKIENRLQDKVTIMELFALSILLGGCIAGATRPNGLKQGLCVGIGSALLILAIFLTSGPPPIGSLLSLMISALILGPLGGWFGTELLPPAYGPARYGKKTGWW